MYNVKKKTCLGVFFEIEENEAMAIKTSLKEREVIEIEKTTSAFHICDARSSFRFCIYLPNGFLANKDTVSIIRSIGPTTKRCASC